MVDALIVLFFGGVAKVSIHLAIAVGKRREFENQKTQTAKKATEYELPCFLCIRTYVPLISGLLPGGFSFIFSFGNTKATCKIGTTGETHMETTIN